MALDLSWAIYAGYEPRGRWFAPPNVAVAFPKCPSGFLTGSLVPALFFVGLKPVQAVVESSRRAKRKGRSLPAGRIMYRRIQTLGASRPIVCAGVAARTSRRTIGPVRLVRNKAQHGKVGTVEDAL